MNTNLCEAVKIFKKKERISGSFNGYPKTNIYLKENMFTELQNSS